MALFILPVNEVGQISTLGFKLHSEYFIANQLCARLLLTEV